MGWIGFNDCFVDIDHNDHFFDFIDKTADNDRRVALFISRNAVFDAANEGEPEPDAEHVDRPIHTTNPAVDGAESGNGLADRGLESVVRGQSSNAGANACHDAGHVATDAEPVGHEPDDESGRHRRSESNSGGNATASIRGSGSLFIDGNARSRTRNASTQQQLRFNVDDFDASRNND